MLVRYGLVGCGAIFPTHADALARIEGAQLVGVFDSVRDKACQGAERYGCHAAGTLEELFGQCDAVIVCTPSGLHSEIGMQAAQAGKHVLVEKPIDTTLAKAQALVDAAKSAGVKLGTISQHRFAASVQRTRQAAQNGELGQLLSGDAYIKWYRSAEYYSRPVKGSWGGEGGGALMNQAIHQVDLLRWFVGPVASVFGMWQLGALHKIESEDIVTAVLRYANGATGTIQAATALWPGYPERVELHGTKGTAIITGDRLTTWDVQDDAGEAPPLSTNVASGASDPMAISLEPFERQFLDFGEAVKAKSRPLVSGDDGLEALALVDAVYRSCRSGQPVAPVAAEVSA